MPTQLFPGLDNKKTCQTYVLLHLQQGSDDIVGSEECVEHISYDDENNKAAHILTINDLSISILVHYMQHGNDIHTVLQ